MKQKILDVIIAVFLVTSMVSLTTAEDTSFATDHFPTNTGNSRDRTWTIVATYPLPEGASGLAYDGTSLYCGIYGANGDEIYQIDPSNGNYQLLCTGPHNDAYGLTYDGTYLWTTDHSSGNPAEALQFDFTGGLISNFTLMGTYVSGIAYDAGDFWVAEYYPDPATIYRVNDTGSIITSFPAPDNQPWDLCMEGTNLWMADYWGDTLYKINTSTGTLMESHASEYTDPAGIVFDGQYLWYCDNGQGGNDYLYKIDLAGSGTPAINVPTTSHNYGVVTIGGSDTWNAIAESVGSANLEITNVTFTGAGSTDLSCPLSFPIIVTPGNQTSIPLTYTPLDFGELTAIATIHSNDPIHPSINITLTGNAVYPGPEILLPEPSHNYGPVRINAYTRWFMEIVNAGDTTLTITNISSNDPHFIIDDMVTFPFNIGVLQSTQIGIWFQPQGATSYSGSVTIHSNDPDENPTDVTVQGSGQEADYPLGDLLWYHTITGGYDNSPKAMAPINDINGDGKSDVIVCSEDDYIRCFNGNGHNTGDVLWEHEIYAGSVYSQKGLVIMDDINSDGYQDVIVGAAWGGRLIRAISGKTGATIWTHDTHEYGDGGWVYQVDSRFDYNDDGINDILAATGNDGTNTGPKRAYCLDALTGVSIWETPLGGATFSVIGIEDCTGDGQPDAVAGASNEDETIGFVYGINGDTGAVIWTFTTSATSVWALEQIDDISHDSIKDIIIGDFYTVSGTIYGLDATNGNDLWNNSLGYVLISRFEKIGDINNDGHPDIIPALLNTDQARAIDGTNGDIIWSKYLADQPYQVATTSDITGDGIDDLVVGTTYTDNYCYWLDGTNGSIVHSFNLGNPVDAITVIPDVVGDMNSTMEMVAGGRNGFVACFSGGGEIESSQQTLNLTLYTGWNMVTVPLENEWTAESLGENISGCTLVLRFNASSQSFVTHVVGTPYDNFPIEDGVGYFVYVSGNTSLDMTASPLSGISVPVSLEWNIIGWPHETPTLAESLGENISGCTLVLMFDAETQVFTTHVVGTPYDNFVVSRGMGLFVYATSESTWTGEG